MINWINVKDRLPEHMQTVLASAVKGGFCVVVFVDSKKMNNFLSEKGFLQAEVDVKNEPYNFCSQEVRGYTLNNVTHWAVLNKPNGGNR